MKPQNRNIPLRGTIASLICSVSILLTHTDAAHAIKTYRCDGRIQFRPCGTDIPAGKIINQTSRKRAADSDVDPINAKIPGERYARVDEPTFSPVSKSTGMWKGFIHGNGKIDLVLQILKDGDLVETRPMGQTYLLNSKTTFAFTSPLPKAPGWSWNVVAKAS